MSRYRKVEVTMWDDAKFRGLSDDAKILFLLMMTGPQQTMLGAARTGPAALGESLGWDAERHVAPFAEIVAAEMAVYDAKARLLWLPNFLKYNQPENPNVVKAWAKCFHGLPDSELKGKLLDRMRACIETIHAQGAAKGFLEAFEKCFGTLSKGLAKPLPKGMGNPFGRVGETIAEGLGEGYGNTESREQEQKYKNSPPAREAEAQPERTAAGMPEPRRVQGVPTGGDVWPEPSAEDVAELEPPQCARALLDGLGLPAPPQTFHVVSEAIRLKARSMRTTAWAAMKLIERQARLAREAGVLVDRFWFEDAKYDHADVGKRAAPPPYRNSQAAVGVGPLTHAGLGMRVIVPDAPDGVDVGMGDRAFAAVRRGLEGALNRKSFETWVLPLRAMGVKDEVLYLRGPSEQFAHIAEKYGDEIAKFLPEGVRVVRVLCAEATA